MIFEDLGTMPYRDAWARQEEAHGTVADGGEERVFFVEHPPVITLGRRAGLEKNILASAEALQRVGVEVVQSDRGGDVTFHGPGQVVMYPIVRLIDHQLSVGAYVRTLQNVVVSSLQHFGIEARFDPQAIGVWVRRPDGAEAKICALGVRVKRGTTLHGIALNVTTDLSYFNLIVPCGLTGRAVTSMREMGRDVGVAEVKKILTEEMRNSFAGAGQRG